MLGLVATYPGAGAALNRAGKRSAQRFAGA